MGNMGRRRCSIYLQLASDVKVCVCARISEIIFHQRACLHVTSTISQKRWPQTNDLSGEEKCLSGTM